MARSGRLLMCLVILLAFFPPSSVSAQVINMSHDLVALGIASQNVTPDVPSLDARPLIQAAVTYIQSHPVQTLTLDKGDYYLLSETRGNAVLAFDALQNVTIDLAGSTIYMQGPMVPNGISLDSDSNVTLTNFNIDFLTPAYIHAQITSVDTTNRILHYQTLPGWPDPTSFNGIPGPFGGSPTFWAAVFRNGNIVPGTTRMVLNSPITSGQLALTQDGTPWTQSATLSTLQAGDTVVVMLRGSGPAILVWWCDSVTLSNINIYGAAERSVSLHETSNSVIYSVRVEPRPVVGLVGSTGDGIHFEQTQQNDHIIGCYASHTMDDGLILDWSESGEVASQPGPAELLITRYGFDRFPVGAVNFVDPVSTVEFTGGTIASENPAYTTVPVYGGSVNVTFTQSLPSVAVGDEMVVADPNLRGQGSTVEDSTVEDTYGGRGIWINGTIGVAVLRNVVRRTSLGGIVVSQDTEAYPSPPAHNIVVQDNALEQDLGPAALGTGAQNSLASVQVVSTNNQSFAFAASPSHTGITIQNNYIADAGRSGIWVGEVDGGSITNNLVARWNQQPQLPIWGIPSQFVTQVETDFSSAIVTHYNAGVTSIGNTTDTTSAITSPVTMLPPNASVTPAASTGSFSITTAVTNFGWKAVSDADWLTVTSTALGRGNGTVQYSVAANDAGARIGHIVIAGVAFTVAQTPGLIRPARPPQPGFPVPLSSAPIYTVVSEKPCRVPRPTFGSASANSCPAAPALHSISTMHGATGLQVVIQGNGFDPSSNVWFNGVLASVISIAPGSIVLGVPANATAGPITVTSASGTSQTLARFTVDSALYVSPTGSDSNPGTLAQPFLTIQKCATTATAGTDCVVRAGTYHETVTPNSGITIGPYAGESVTVDGSDAVTGWTLYQGSIYKASVTLNSDDTNQIFVGNQMMTEARWPNGDDLFHVNWATMQTGTTNSVVMDSNLPNINWAGAKIHMWSGTDPWDPQTGTITASLAAQVTFTVDGASFPPYIQPTSGGYYYLYGILGALDTQNEWVYDAPNQVLYLWAPGGVNPSTLDVRAKRRQFAFDLSGKSKLTILGLNLFANAINMNASSANNVIDGISAQYVSHFTSLPDVPGYPSSYWYDHTSDSGIIINGSGNILQNSIISYSAGNGVTLGGSNNIARNNLIDHSDYMANNCAAITLPFNAGTGNRIVNNTLHTAARFNIDPLGGDTMDISYNNLFSAMTTSRDGGELYTGQIVTSSRIHHNWFHDTQSLISGPADTINLSGVYLDEDSSGWEVDQNVLWNNQNYNIALVGSNTGRTNPNNNYIHNNTIPDVNSTGYIFTLFNTSTFYATCGTTQIVDNLVFVPVTQIGTIACPAINNNATAPGATEMNGIVQVGCNFAGCASEGPPTISGGLVGPSIAVEPFSRSVVSGQTATFVVIAEGSPTLAYQWQKNGVDISGATGAVYITPVTTILDTGSLYTVRVSNSVGSQTSNAAILTVIPSSSPAQRSVRRRSAKPAPLRPSS